MDSNRPSLLIIEESPQRRSSLVEALTQLTNHQFELIETDQALKGLELARKRKPLAVFAHTHLPVLSGIDLCKLLKDDPKTQLIQITLLSSHPHPQEEIRALNAGASAYLTYPLQASAITAQIEKFTSVETVSPQKSFECADFLFDPVQKVVEYRGKQVRLTWTEFQILACLAQSQGQVVSRQEILEKIWKDSAGTVTPRTIDVHVRALRKKIPDLSSQLHSRYGEGYRLESN